MESMPGALFLSFVVLGVTILTVLAFFTPLFLYRMMKEIGRINRTTQTISNVLKARLPVVEEDEPKNSAL